MAEVNNEDRSRTPLDEVVGNIVQAVGGEAGLITLWDSQKQRRLEICSYGLTDEVLSQIEPLVDEVAARLSREDLNPEDSRPVVKGVPTDLAGRHAIAFPLRSSNRLIGLLCLFHPSQQPLLLEENPSLRNIIVEQVHVVVQNARLIQRLAEEKRWLEAVVTHSSDGILIVDYQARIIGLNPALERLSGWRAREARGRRCNEIIQLHDRSGRDLCAEACPLLASLTPGRPSRTVEGLITTRDGRKIDVEANCTVIFGERGEVLGGIIGLRDISARKEAEELQSTFLSVISHELQTPIAVIRGYAELLGEEGVQLAPQQLREKLGIIREESQRLSKMVENLLYASRIQAGGITLQREPLALAGLVRTAVQKMSGVSKKHRFVVEVPDSLPTVLADYERIYEVLTNLLDNAIKYSPGGGTILIEGRSTGSEVVISVTDQGVGIPEGERERIFERFARLSSGLVRQRKGAGLGLFICKSIVEAHGGRIWVEAAPGGGARFSFSLPREAPAQLPVLFGRGATLSPVAKVANRGKDAELINATRTSERMLDR